MKKKFLVGLLAVVMCFALVGCGKTENKDSENGGSTNNGGSSENSGSTAISDISTSNYVNVTKTNFGIDPSVSGLKISKAKAQGSSQITLVYSIESGSEEELVKAFFEKCLNASDDKAVYRQEWPNDGGYNVTVGEKVTSWSSWLQDEAYDQNWFYKVGGKTIAFGGSEQSGKTFEVTINFK